MSKVWVLAQHCEDGVGTIAMGAYSTRALAEAAVEEEINNSLIWEEGEEQREDVFRIERSEEEAFHGFRVDVLDAGDDRCLFSFHACPVEVDV